MKKRVFYTEAAYAAGLLLLAFGTALTAYGDFGISMVVAPAYILYLKLSQAMPFFSFGVAEYVLQGLILLLMLVVIRRIKLTCFLSFATAILYGVLLDLAMDVTALIPGHSLWLRILLYAAGVLLGCAGIALLFQTYFPPAAYEMFVKQLARKLKKPIAPVKTAYDCCSMLLAVAMSLLLFGRLEGIGIASVLCAFANGSLIRMATLLLEKFWAFQDGLPLRRYFEESEESL